MCNSAVLYAVVSAVVAAPTLTRTLLSKLTESMYPVKNWSLQASQPLAPMNIGNPTGGNRPGDRVERNSGNISMYTFNIQVHDEIKQ